MKNTQTLGPPSELEWPGRTSLPLWNNVEANPLLTMPSTEMSVTCPRLSGSARTDLFAASPTKLGGREVHAVWSRLTERLGPVGVNLLKSMLRYNPSLLAVNGYAFDLSRGFFFLWCRRPYFSCQRTSPSVVFQRQRS